MISFVQQVDYVGNTSLNHQLSTNFEWDALRNYPQFQKILASQSRKQFANNWRNRFHAKVCRKAFSRPKISNRLPEHATRSAELQLDRHSTCGAKRSSK